ncbi:MAG: RNA methyltransferase [Lentisphaeria bacterium]|nr:RNA methyltransferase [Lentisphaeria bacterium]
MGNDLVPQIQTGDDLLTQAEEKMPVVIVLDRLRSAFNVGNIFRLAEITGSQEVVTCGYTATPPHPKLEKSARGCDEIVACRHFETTKEAILALKEEGFKIWAVDTFDSAIKYTDLRLEFKQPIAFVVGNEALGIQQELLPFCDHFVKIPVYGFKNSLNVGNATAIILYKVRQCWEEIQKNEQKVRCSQT